MVASTLGAGSTLGAEGSTLGADSTLGAEGSTLAVGSTESAGFTPAFLPSPTSYCHSRSTYRPKSVTCCRSVALTFSPAFALLDRSSYQLPAVSRTKRPSRFITAASPSMISAGCAGAALAVGFTGSTLGAAGSTLAAGSVGVAPLLFISLAAVSYCNSRSNHWSALVGRRSLDLTLSPAFALPEISSYQLPAVSRTKRPSRFITAASPSVISAGCAGAALAAGFTGSTLGAAGSVGFAGSPLGALVPLISSAIGSVGISESRIIPADASVSGLRTTGESALTVGSAAGVLAVSVFGIAVSSA